jgi:hypothetical protein
MGHIGILLIFSIILMYLGRKVKNWNDKVYFLALFAAAIQTVIELYAMFRMPWPE